MTEAEDVAMFGRFQGVQFDMDESFEFGDEVTVTVKCRVAELALRETSSGSARRVHILKPLEISLLSEDVDIYTEATSDSVDDFDLGVDDFDLGEPIMVQEPKAVEHVEHVFEPSKPVASPIIPESPLRSRSSLQPKDDILARFLSE